jgi:hypothetical protein
MHNVNYIVLIRYIVLRAWVFYRWLYESDNLIWSAQCAQIPCYVEE